MSYNKCICQKCGSVFASMIDSEEDIKKEACPNCGEKKLSITGPLSFDELSSLFQGG
jgi:predicted  nucleic acid-binding Zn-ribbon protein